MSDSWNPKQYEKFKDERSQPFFDLMSLLQPHEQADVIDLGCGTAELTAILQQKMNAKRTVGIDTSDEMLARAAQFKNDKLFFRKDSIENFKEEKAFDIVFSNADESRLSYSCSSDSNVPRGTLGQPFEK